MRPGSLRVIAILLALLLSFGASSSALGRGFSVPAAGKLAGLGSAQTELALNVCLDDQSLIDRYGSGAANLIKVARRKWPRGLCSNPKVAADLYRWNYLSSAVLAHSTKLSVIQEITEKQSKLRSCKTLNCLSRTLSSYNEWAGGRASRLPMFAGAIFEQSTLIGPPLEFPHLAVRNLKLPLQGQQLSCGSSSMDSLQFFSPTIKLPGKALVVAQCVKDASHKRVWLLQSEASDLGWSDILVFDGRVQIHVLQNEGGKYASLYTVQKLGSEDLVNVYLYDKTASRYKAEISYLVSTDQSGLSHAFLID